MKQSSLVWWNHSRTPSKVGHAFERVPVGFGRNRLKFKGSDHMVFVVCRSHESIRKFSRVAVAAARRHSSYRHDTGRI